MTTPGPTQSSSPSPGTSPSPSSSPSPGTTSTATPWLDESTAAGAPVLALHARSQPHHHAAVITLAALYAGFIGWTYIAWYRRPWRDFRWGGDGTWKLWQHDSWFGTQQYAGG
ncbi:MAG: hypothetical protein H7287_12295, partial [Thermoleophilia bacterium]|nr:hypothetical protein [Thermoleophilia bacterium]